MGEHSGRYGVVDGQSTVGQFSINDGHNPAVAVASNTVFGTARRPAVQEWTGSFAQFGHTPLLLPGALFSFLGYTAPEDDASGVGQTYAGDALVSQVGLTWNWAAGDIIQIAIDFLGHLELTRNPAGAQIFDVTEPTLPVVAGTKIEYSVNGTDWTEWTSLTTAQLNLINAVQQYVNSSTFVNDVLWTGRKAGNFDWNLAVTEQNTNRSRFQKGDQLWLRLYVSDDEYWELKTGIVEGFSGITVNRQTGAIIQQTINIGMNAVDVETGAIGHVLDPAANLIWGTA